MEGTAEEEEEEGEALICCKMSSANLSKFSTHLFVVVLDRQKERERDDQNGCMSTKKRSR